MTLELSILIPGNGCSSGRLYGPKFIGFGQMSVPGCGHCPGPREAAQEPKQAGK